MSKPNQARIDRLNKIEAHGREAGFVANVIQCWHRKPNIKLKGLLALLNQGKHIQIAPQAIDVLLVDGERFPWANLETVK